MCILSSKNAFNPQHLRAAAGIFSPEKTVPAASLQGLWVPREVLLRQTISFRVLKGIGFRMGDKNAVTEFPAPRFTEIFSAE